MEFSANFNVLMIPRSGTVFHKSPEVFLLKEKNISGFLNGYCSPCCRVRRDFKTTLPGRSSGRTFIKKERGGSLRMDGYGINFHRLRHLNRDRSRGDCQDRKIPQRTDVLFEKNGRNQCSKDDRGFAHGSHKRDRCLRHGP